MRLREKRRAIRALCALTLVTSAFVGQGALESSAAPSRSELEAAKDRLLELERDFEIVVEEFNAVRERLTEIQSNISDIELVVTELENRMSGRLEDAERLAEELYKSGSSGSMVAVLSSDTLAELDARLAYIETSEEANARLFERLSADRSLLEEKLGQLEEAEEEAAATKGRLEGLRTNIESKLADQEDEIDELTAAIERAERREAAREAAARDAARAAAAEEAAAEVPDPSTGGGPPAVGGTPAANPRAQIAVDAALSQVGKPYQWGAAGPNSYDCSGLTMWAWAQAGVSLPHNSGMQYSATPRVAQSDWQPGDLLFYGSPIHHVAMYIGGGRVVEAPYSGQTVRVASAYRSDLVGAGRP